MSFNQSKTEKSDGQQLRKTGRSGSFGQQRGYSGGDGRKGGGPAPPPQLSSPSSSKNPPIFSNRSFKNSGYGQGGSSRANPSNSRASDAVAPAAPVALRAVQNGVHPRAPISQSVSGPSTSTAPMTPVKVLLVHCFLPSSDGTKTFTLQFGSIPARTTSAPPNLDEQKQGQARHGSFRGVSKVPIPLDHSSHNNLRRMQVVLANLMLESLFLRPSWDIYADGLSTVPCSPAIWWPQSSVAVTGCCSKFIANAYDITCWKCSPSTPKYHNKCFSMVFSLILCSLNR